MAEQFLEPSGRPLLVLDQQDMGERDLWDAPAVEADSWAISFRP